MSRVRGGWGVLFVAPATLLLLLFFVLPIFYSARLSFYEVGWTEDTWIGLENYRQLLHEDEFWSSARVTGKFFVAYMLFNMVVSYLVAIALSRLSHRLCGAMLTLYRVPGMFGVIGSVVFWRWFYRLQGGALNDLLAQLHLPAIDWLGRPETALWGIAFAMMMPLVAGSSLLYVAAIGQVDRELLEAARLDGANELQVIWHILTPLTNRIRLYILVTNLVGAMQIWEHPFFFTGGGPLGSTRPMMYEVFHKAFEKFDFGMGSAMTVVMVMITLGLAVGFMGKLREAIE